MKETGKDKYIFNQIFISFSDVKISRCFGHYIDATGIPHLQFQTFF